MSKLNNKIKQPEEKAFFFRIKRLLKANFLLSITCVISVILLFICAMTCSCAVQFPPEVTNKITHGIEKKYEKILISGEKSKNGIFDPSIEYGPDGKIGWLAYSSVNEFPKDVSTQIARTTDYGKTWTKMVTVNIAEKATINHKGEKIEGIWRHEVPALVHVPNDPDPNKRWKLYWHRYFARKPLTGDKHRMCEYGWIAYKYAPSPKGPWSKETALFGAGQFPCKPYKTKQNLNEFHSDLKNIVAYTEPGILYKNGCIYLALEAHYFEDWQHKVKIILLKSTNYGKRWKYLGTLLNNADAKKLGCIWLVASSLTQEKGRLFLFISPFTQKDHYGTFVIEFEDIQKARLKRDSKGVPLIHKFLPPSMIANAGESDYDENNKYGGIIMPQANIKAYPEILQVFNTRQKIIGK